MSVIDCSKCIHCEVCGDRYANDGHAGECSYFLGYNPTSDCVSREALKGVIETYRPALIYNNKTDMKNRMVDYFLDEIDNAEAVFDDKAYSQGYKQGVCDELNARPKGEWIDYSPISWKCSCCGYGVNRWNNTPFCPNCGTSMKGGAE